MEEKKKGITEGPAIFIESLLNQAEFFSHKRLYPNTSWLIAQRPIASFKEGEFKWRWRMGESLSVEEIKTINQRLLELRILIAAKDTP